MPQFSIAETVLPGADEHQPEMDHAPAKLEGRIEPVYHHVRGADACPLTETPFTQNSGHPPGLRLPQQKSFSTELGPKLPFNFLKFTTIKSDR